ncbi:MAG TPA: hypothetical protein VFG21_08165 [Xanthomonadaceae bacterium]|nr:hypothetical protein [Xanthomonadaceae bacterium]
MIRPVLLMALAVVGPTAQSQDPDFDVPEPMPAWVTQGELNLRADRVTGLPGGRPDLERLRARLRLGLRWTGTDGLEAGLAVEGARGSDSNTRNRINNDNERSDEANLDALWLGLARPQWRLRAGRDALPIELSPMLWDIDHRPSGLSARIGRERGFDRWQLDAGAFAFDHPLGGSARLSALQLGWHAREGAPFGFGAQLAYLHFGDADELALHGLARGNRVDAGGGYRDGFRLLDLQLYGRWHTGAGPLQARLDRVRNLAADDRADGTRFSLVLGDLATRPGWEAGYAWQRIQADAVLAAANADDWWFHAGARGHMPWIGYSFASGFASVRAAGFFETRDGSASRTDRLLLDLVLRW